MESSAAPLPDDSQLASPPAAVDAPVGRRGNPDELRASLDAVRVAQETAQARARRETQRARLIVISLMAAVGIVVWSVSTRRSSKPQQAIAAPIAAPVIAPPAPVVTHPAPQAVPEPAPVVAAPAAVATGAEDISACDAVFAQRQWTSVATACAAAFKARPTDSALAMRVAQAEHRRGHVAAAGDWARNAIALDPNIPEAYAILARAEIRAGHPRAAATAYRRYLTLAPQGWHAPEARRALGDAR